MNILIKCTGNTIAVSLCAKLAGYVEAEQSECMGGPMSRNVEAFRSIYILCNMTFKFLLTSR